MSYREHLPAPALAPFVDRFWTRVSELDERAGRGERSERNEADGDAASLILPDGCIDVIVRVDRGGEARVVGTMSQAAVVSAAGAAQMAAVRFRPGGAAAMLGLAAGELADRAEPLAALGAIGRELESALKRSHALALKGSSQRDATPGRKSGSAELRRAIATSERGELDASRGSRRAFGATSPEDLAAARDGVTHAADRSGGSATERALAALEGWMLGRLALVRAPDPLVAHAVARLFSPAAPATSALADELGVSRQHLRRLFLHHVGLAPKELGRIARLQRTVDHLQRFPSHAMAQAALTLGYFDQAHMARELRLLAGVSATQVRAQASSIFPIRSLLGGADWAHEEPHP